MSSLSIATWGLLPLSPLGIATDGYLSPSSNTPDIDVGGGGSSERRAYQGAYLRKKKKRNEDDEAVLQAFIKAYLEH